MEYIVIGIMLGLLGLVLGSFAGATVWRMRARQLVEDKASGEEIDAKEYKRLLPLTQTSFKTDRSRCLHCGHTLAWYDLLPLVSWLSTRGKCRYCHKPIGWFEPVIELSGAIFFVGSYLLWPSLATTPDVISFILWLISGVLLAVLFAYDLKWFLLPNRIMLPLTLVGVLMACTRLYVSADVAAALITLAIGVVILSGLYLLLWLVSKGQWIGFGDVKLGLALALIVGNWQLAFITLFAANLIGCLLVIPGMLAGKISRQTRVPFGPLLILGAVIAVLWGTHITTWYFSMFML